MQDFLDNQEMQVKKMAKFDPEKEEYFKRLSVYDFIFHVYVLNENQD